MHGRKLHLSSGNKVIEARKYRMVKKKKEALD
jgi:hypothetical protein